MLDKITHINSQNQTLNIGENGIYLNYSQLRDFGAESVVLPFVLLTDRATQDKFFEHFETDFRNEESGYFEINGYKRTAIIQSSSNSNFLENTNKAKKSLSFNFTTSSWIKEHKNTFMPVSQQPRSEIKKQYPYTYPYKYGIRQGETTLINQSNFLQNAIISLYGEDINPYIFIGGNLYQINIEVASGERVEINTKTKTVLKYNSLGASENVYGQRNINVDVFAKIKSGENTVIWNPQKTAEVLLLEERGEPKWQIN